MSHTATSLLIKALAELTDSRTQMSTEPFARVHAARSVMIVTKIGNGSKDGIAVDY
jgi:hypothetical protein